MIGENLESRLVFCAPCDVTGDGFVSPVDALVVINAVNNGGESGLDVNRDGFTSPQDVLVVINYLNLGHLESEAENIRVLVHDPNTIGLTATEILFAIDEALAFWDFEITNYDFMRVDVGPSDIDIFFAELYDGDGLHHRGEQLGDVIRFHSGIIAPFHHSGENGPVDRELLFQVFADVQALARVTAHELGHWLGLGHSDDPNCLMHSNAGTWDLC